MAPKAFARASRAIGATPVLGTVLGCLLALFCAACAAPGSDIHLAPLYTRLATADGGRQVELLAGVIQVDQETPGGWTQRWGLRPLLSQARQDETHRQTYFLVPLGKSSRTPKEKVDVLWPLYRRTHTLLADGRTGWSVLIFPIFYWARRPDDSTARAVFPLAGVLNRFLTFERITFVLFPLFARTTQSGHTTTHFLWPIFAWSNEPGHLKYRIWPLFGRSKLEGKYDRGFFLWPIFNWQKNRLDRPEEERETKWLVWPLIGRAHRGSYRSTSVLWPFFGYARDTETGFWAWDGPWPLVRIQRPGTGPNQAYRTRFWPFYGYLDADGAQSTSVLWPIVSWHREQYKWGERTAQYVIPLWQNWEKVDLDGRRREAWQKLWPLYQVHERAGRRRFAFPALNPFWPTPVIDYHYAWLYELFARETDTGIVRERSWGAFWRRESDPGEDRRSFTGLWARRAFSREGERVAETSLLFGLLRWRSGPSGGTQLLRPAFPGPGWPALRVPPPIPDAAPAVD